MNAPRITRASIRRAALPVVAAVAAATFFSATATASAACYGSTPSSVVFSDPIDGESGLAPEILTIQAAVDGACHYSVDPGVTRSLIDGDAVFIFIDTDGNAATGSVVFDGADIVVGTLGLSGPDTPPMRGVWNGTTFTFTDPAPIGSALGNGGFSASVDALPIASGTTTQLLISTSWAGSYDDYFDFAPAVGMIPLSVMFSTTPPAPAPVPAPVQPTKPIAPATDASADDRCTVPRVRGMSVASARTRLRSAGCRLAASTRRSYSPTVRRGRVVGATVQAHAKTSRTVGLVVSLGKRPRRARKASHSTLDQLNVLVAAELRRAGAITR